MHRFHGQLTIAAIIIALVTGAPLVAFTQETEGRPHIDRDTSDRTGNEGHDGRVEVHTEREKALEDETKKIDEKLKALDDRKNYDGLKRGEDRASDDKITKVEEIGKKSELTKAGNAEVHDLDTLLKETNRDSENDRKLFKSAEELSREVIETRNEKGNYGLGSATADVADRAGHDFVGEDARISSEGNALVSKDGLRQYRYPEYKGRIDKTQANFERRNDPEGNWISNGHVDIMHE